MTREPAGADVREAAAAFCALLVPNSAMDWSAPAGQLAWSVTEVVAHVADVCGFYAIHLGTHSRRRLRFDVTLHAGASVSDRVATITGLAEHLARVIAASPPDARAWHHHGLADPAGFAAMACDELLVHGSDIAEAWQQPFEPDLDLCGRVLVRLFPWAPAGVDPWKALRWANGRIALSDHPRLSPHWASHSAPLSEWDGRRLTAQPPPDQY